MLESKLLTGLLFMMTVFVIAFDGIKSAHAQGASHTERRDAEEIIKLLRCLENTPIGRAQRYGTMISHASEVARGKVPDLRRRVCRLYIIWLVFLVSCNFKE